MKPSQINRLQKLAQDLKDGRFTDDVYINMLDSVIGRAGMNAFEDERIRILTEHLDRKANTPVPYERIDMGGLGSVNVFDLREWSHLWQHADQKESKATAVSYMAHNHSAIQPLLDTLQANRQGYVHDLIKTAFRQGFKAGALRERAQHEPIQLGGKN